MDRRTKVIIAVVIAVAALPVLFHVGVLALMTYITVATDARQADDVVITTDLAKREPARSTPDSQAVRELEDLLVKIIDAALAGDDDALDELCVDRGFFPRDRESLEQLRNRARDLEWEFREPGRAYVLAGWRLDLFFAKTEKGWRMTYAGAPGVE